MSTPLAKFFLAEGPQDAPTQSTTHFGKDRGRRMADDREQLADFMEFVNGNLAREVLVEDWDEKLWGDRYHPIPITDEPEALEARLRRGEGKSRRARRRLGGFHCAQALLDGKPLHGIWIDRSKL